MQNLLLLFIRFGGFIVFVLLELVCLFLIVNFNKKHSQIWVHSGNRVAGTSMDIFDGFLSYLDLDDVNDELARENASLYAQLKDAKYNNQISIDSTKVGTDSLEQQYSFIAAKVINNSINRNNNSLTLNRGSEHKIGRHMGVIGQNGIVGVVRDVSKHYSRVASLLHSQTRISAAVKRNNYFGSLIWNGQDPRFMNLVDVPKHADLRIGDTIVTSGFSVMFPKGIMIGTIDDYELESGSNYYDIVIELSGNLSNADYVYVVNNLFRKEQEKLEQEVRDE